MTDQRPVARLFQVPNKDGEFCGEKMEVVHEFLQRHRRPEGSHNRFCWDWLRRAGDGCEVYLDRSSGKVDQHGSTTVACMLAIVGGVSHFGFVISLFYQICLYRLLAVGHLFGQ